MSIVPVDQIHYHLRHHILLLGAALGDHQRQGDQCVVVQKARAVGTVKNAVVLQEPQEQERCDAFVTVAERVVFDRPAEQIGRLFLDNRVEITPAESLVNRTHRAFERLVLLAGEQCAAAKLVAQHLQRLHRILIGRAERLLRCSGRYLQLLIIVAVERIESVITRSSPTASDFVTSFAAKTLESRRTVFFSSSNCSALAWLLTA